ncbi:hypothetical protein ACTXT7_004331 [Hymenolepis weldensis]
MSGNQENHTLSELQNHRVICFLEFNLPQVHFAPFGDIFIIGPLVFMRNAIRDMSVNTRLQLLKLLETRYRIRDLEFSKTFINDLGIDLSMYFCPVIGLKVYGSMDGEIRRICQDIVDAQIPQL